MRLKAGGSLVAGGALGMAIPVITAKKLEKEVGDKISSANKRIADKRGLNYTPARSLSGKVLKLNGKPLMEFKSSIDNIKKIKEAFLSTLVSIYHNRVVYPSASEEKKRLPGKGSLFFVRFGESACAASGATGLSAAPEPGPAAKTPRSPARPVPR